MCQKGDLGRSLSKSRRESVLRHDSSTLDAAALADATRVPNGRIADCRGQPSRQAAPHPNVVHTIQTGELQSAPLALAGAVELDDKLMVRDVHEGTIYALMALLQPGLRSLDWRREKGGRFLNGGSEDGGLLEFGLTLASLSSTSRTPFEQVPDLRPQTRLFRVHARDLRVQAPGSNGYGRLFQRSANLRS